ncbi:hypothetical protein PS880_00270 [Pseudomonas fluorescens]|uniref:Uncharacterized protein n=1 Tax=Pseudomonas fluorescens TaxID=294 RepID=A0A5E7GN65_PSEFL|nr:hypothetical protein PS880_00270 [Pseudomonas fluorescens]
MAVGLTCEAVHKSMSENYDPQRKNGTRRYRFFVLPRIQYPQNRRSEF